MCIRDSGELSFLPLGQFEHRGQAAPGVVQQTSVRRQLRGRGGHDGSHDGDVRVSGADVAAEDGERRVSQCRAQVQAEPGVEPFAVHHLDLGEAGPDEVRPVPVGRCHPRRGLLQEPAPQAVVLRYRIGVLLGEERAQHGVGALDVVVGAGLEQPERVVGGEPGLVDAAALGHAGVVAGGGGGGPGHPGPGVVLGVQVVEEGGQVGCHGDGPSAAGQGGGGSVAQAATRRSPRSRSLSSRSRSSGAGSISGARTPPASRPRRRTPALTNATA